MALDFNNARLILWLRSQGVVLGDVLTVGRLGVFVSLELLSADAQRFNVQPTANHTWESASSAKYCEPLLLAMGASTVRALDYSDYEGAQVLHDLNQPLPTNLESCCDTLFDSGSLEHVFNVPVALDCYSKLIRPGGCMVLDMPANGCCGHGFYQFSPELFYQYFNGRQGFQVQAVFAVEDEPMGKWYRVPSPTSVGGRVYLYGDKPLHIYVIVKRLESSLGEALAPIQVDYTQAWNKEEVPLELKVAQQSLIHSIAGLIRGMAKKWLPITYWKWSVVRNAARNRRPFVVNRSDVLKEVDPFKVGFQG